VQFNPVPAPEDRPRPAGYVADPAAAGSTAAAAAAGGSPLVAGNAAAAESVAPSPTSTTSACTEAGGCDDGFLKAMVDDASFLFGDFYLDGNQDGSISFWEGHAFS